MIELIFVACMTGAPGNCEERSLLYVDITPMKCLMGAQPELANWVNTHPGYAVKSWQCREMRVGEHDV